MFTIRQAEERDQQAILALTAEAGVFTTQDVACVDELLQVYLYQPQKHDYTFVTACDAADRVVGYICYGPTPLTIGTWDIYWIAVGKAERGRGVGQALMQHAEQEIAAQGGRLVVLETSGTPEYSPARKFYEHCGYTGRI